MRVLARLTALAALCLLSLPAAAEEITFLYMKQSGYELADVVERAESFFKETGIRVKPVFVEYKDRYSLLRDSARKQVPDFDLLLLDLIWTAEFADRVMIDPVPAALVARVREGIVPKISSAFEYAGRLWALPFHADFQLLYTNLQLLERAGFSSPPRTLEEMATMAKEAKRRGVVRYPIFDSWDQQEVLVCEFTWLTGAFGGSLTDAGGRIDCVSLPSRRALSFMVSLLDEGLMNPYSLHSDENFAAEVFQAGDCLFTTNWLYLTGLLAKSSDPSPFTWVASPIPVSRDIPAGGPGTSSVCGFEGLAVAARSAHKPAAWRFARYLDSPEFQSRHLELMPVWREVWGRAETRKNDPWLSVKQRQIEGLVYRPVHPRYGLVSAVLQEWIFKALAGRVAPDEALRQAQARIDAGRQ